MAPVNKINLYFFSLQAGHGMPSLNPAFSLPGENGVEEFLSRLRSAGYGTERHESYDTYEIYHDTYDTRLHRAMRCLIYLPERELWRLEGCKTGSRLCLWEGRDINDDSGIMEILKPATRGLTLYPWLRVRRLGTLWSAGVRTDFRVSLAIESVFYEHPLDETRRASVEYPSVIILPDGEDEGEPGILAALLRDMMGLKPLTGDYFVDGLTRLGTPMAGLPVGRDFPVAGTTEMRETCSRLIMVQLYRMWSTREGALAGLENEYVHDMRVATRRLRTLLKATAPWTGSEQANRLSKRLKILARLLGEVRDADVFSDSIEEYLNKAHAGNPAAAGVLVKCLALFTRSRRSLARNLRSSGFFTLLNSLRIFSEQLAVPGAAGIPSRETAARIIGSLAEQILARTDTPVSGLSTAEIHSIRIDFKRLRYHAEFFMDLFDGKLKKSVKEITEFQDCLGDYNDAMVALELLKKITQRYRRAGGKTVDELMLLGGVVEMYRRKAESSLRIFREQWNGAPGMLINLLKRLQLNAGKP